MLSLQIAGSHVRTWLDALARVFLTVLQIIFIDDSQGERVQDCLFEFFIDRRRVVGGEQIHLSGKWKIKIENPTMRAMASLIVNIAIRTDVPPGMCAV